MSNSKAVRDALAAIATEMGVEHRIAQGGKHAHLVFSIDGAEFTYSFSSRADGHRLENAKHGLRNAIRTARERLAKMKGRQEQLDLGATTPPPGATNRKFERADDADEKGWSADGAEGFRRTEEHHGALVYKGAVIDVRDEMLSLTSMWKAAGSDPSRRPVEWLRSADARRFVDFLCDSMGLEPAVGNSHPSLFRIDVGSGPGGKGGGGTWAHWQIGLAYAKYLEPKFHVWCNDVVRKHMMAPHERPTSDAAAGRAAVIKDIGQILDIVQDVRRDVEQALGISKMVNSKVTGLETTILPLANIAINSELSVDALAKLQRLLEPGPILSVIDLANSWTADQIIDLLEIPKAERQKGTTQMITHRLREFCADRGVLCQRTDRLLNPSRPWRFPIATAQEWLFGPTLGAELIRTQIAEMKKKKASGKGQGNLSLVPK